MVNSSRQLKLFACDEWNSTNQHDSPLYAVVKEIAHMQFEWKLENSLRGTLYCLTKPVTMQLDLRAELNYIYVPLWMGSHTGSQSLP